MGTLPRVSIVTTFLNPPEGFFREALDSVLAQTFGGWELLLVNDGSGEESGRIADEYAAREPRIRLLEHENRENRGMGASRNLAFRHARGEYVAFLDADDVWLPAKLGRQIEVLAARPELGIVTTRIRDFRIPELAHLEPADDRPRDGLVTQTGLARREVFDRVGLLEEDLTHYDGQAWELQARRMGVEIERLDEVLVLRRLHFHNLSRRRGPESPEGLLRILERVRKEGRS